MSSTIVPTTTGHEGTPASDTNHFHAADYVVFGGMLCLSASIGVWIAVRDRRRQRRSTNDYLMASRAMRYGPVTLSLVASFMSSVTILGLPSEYYVYGTMFSWFGLLYLLLPLAIIFIYLPVFYNLGISSAYEYLELRFGRGIRLLVTTMYLVLSIIYGGIVTYGPALALSEVTGLHMWGSILCTGFVCMFYTALGGLKAVIWTDVVQAILMISGFIIVIIQGSINLGGFGNIWDAAKDGGRIDFIHFELDPRIRHTFWSIMSGGFILWVSIYGVNQSQVQRYVCCRTIKDAKIAILLNSIGLVVILILAGMTGLTIYATYKDCDPLDSGKVSRSDQLFPYIIMDIVGHLPGVPGLFVAAVFSSSLSTVSSGINAMACVTVEDFIRPATKWNEHIYTRVSRALTVAYGSAYILFAFVASNVGGLIRMSYSVHGILSGPVVGVFTMGMLCPWLNNAGAVSGTLIGLATNIWLFIGSTFYPALPKYTRPMPRSTEECIQSTHSTLAYGNYTSASDGLVYETSSHWSSPEPETSVVAERPPIAELYSISYLHFATVGFLTTVMFGNLVSLITGGTKKNPPDPELLTPCIRKNVASKGGKHRKADGDERSSSWVTPEKMMVESPDDTKVGSGTATFFPTGGKNDANENIEEMAPLNPWRLPPPTGVDESGDKESSF